MAEPCADPAADPAGDAPATGADRWPALAEDLLTDWVPDAVAGAGADPADDDACEWLVVSTASGPRSVPLAPIGLRIRGHLAAERALSPREAAMPAAVCGYRDA